MCEKEEMLEFEQNTIDDFYPSTKELLSELLDWTFVKFRDFIRDGELLTKSSVLERLGDAIKYVKTFAFGGDFQGER